MMLLMLASYIRCGTFRERREGRTDKQGDSRSRITKCQLSLLIGIGYILPTFGECMSIGGFLCALRAQGWGNISDQECTFSYMYTGQLPPGQVPDLTTSPWTSSRPDNFPPPRQVPGPGSLLGGSCLLAVQLGLVQMGLVQMGVVQMGLILLWLVQMGLVHLGLVQMTPQSK